MTDACGTVDPRALVRSLVSVADCQAAALGSDGWHALAASPLFAGLLTGLLTIAVAWHGYRLLAAGAGGAVVPADAAALLVRIGVVIALATSWQAYDRLIYRAATQGPGEIARTIFPAAGIETGALGRRLQNAHDAIAGPPEPAAPPPGAQAGAGGGAGAEATTGTSAARRSAATVLLVAGAGPLVAARYATALLLALGPIAIAALLFEATAGLLIGWLRALIGAMLAGLAVPLSIGLELAMLDGPVRAAVSIGAAEMPGVAPIVWIFALVTAALIWATQRIAGGLRLPRLRAAPSVRHDPAAAAASPAHAAAAPGSAAAAAAAIPVAPSRALAIARAAEARVQAAAGRGSAAPPAAAGGDGRRRSADLADQARRAAAGRRAIGAKR